MVSCAIWVDAAGIIKADAVSAIAATKPRRRSVLACIFVLLAPLFAASISIGLCAAFSAQ
ncbi:hypothetical protein CEV31_1269 [Brucella thiophenivorans]|uniref:Uncharacterized protein n=1 Tax=Brucella thiophenivorans TaxID=571255 RepID=A0A256FYN8_9HYPH|nr:hypothetical protein CEV31_1269 [Brucella thiophenivorans]